VYRFTLDDLGPFEHRIPVEQDTTEALREAIKRKEEILRGAEEG